MPNRPKLLHRTKNRSRVVLTSGSGLQKIYFATYGIVWNVHNVANGCCSCCYCCCCRATTASFARRNMSDVVLFLYIRRLEHNANIFAVTDKDQTFVWRVGGIFLSFLTAALKSVTTLTSGGEIARATRDRPPFPATLDFILFAAPEHTYT